MMNAPSAGSRAGEWAVAWRHLVALSFRRQWWSLQTLLAVGLIGMVAVLVGLRSLWGWDYAGFLNGIIDKLYVGFLLPLVCLCVGTQIIGGEWEDRSLIWVLTRPLPRSLIYSGKFVAAVPWALTLTLGSLVLLGALAGSVGLTAVAHAWPAVTVGTLAYLSLFVLMGAAFRRSTVVAIVYAFVIETLVGNMPGNIKQASLAFYTRSLLSDAERSDVFIPVEPATAAWTLASVALVGFLMGLIVFARREYHELT